MSCLDRPFGSDIDRSKPIRFSFDGRSYTGFAGDSIASALLANGVWLLSRSFKYHRARGPFSMAGQDANTLVQIGPEANVLADRRAIHEGLVVEGQNFAGSLRRDRRRLIGLLARFLPAGFYYKAFHRPRRAWRFWEPKIRELAGLGRVDPSAAPGDYDKAYAFADVAVVGGGAAGMAAALAAAQAGAEVALIEEWPRLGGWLRFARPDAEGLLAARELRGLEAAVRAEPRIRVSTGAIANGWFADHWLPVLRDNRMTKLRTKATVIAAGAIEQPAVFRHNDLPGIVTAGAAQRLVRLFGVKPGREAVVLTANGDGYGCALDLADAGVEIKAVLDLRADQAEEPRLAEVRRRGIAVRAGCAIAEAVADRMNSHVSAVKIGRVDSDGAVTGASEIIRCDLVCLAVGAMPTAHLALHGGGRMSYDEAAASFRLTTSASGVFSAGAVNGHMTVADAVADGERAGALAAASAGFPVLARPALPAAAPYNHPYPVFPHAKGKDFVDFDEDQCHGDIVQACEEGFEHVELLKRYTTIGMGPSQGRHSALNTARILARLRGKSIDAVGLTTWRPPFTEETFGHLAGRGFHPVRLTPMHDRHVALGAQLVPAGLWLRPGWYGRADERDDRVTREAAAVRGGAGMIDISTLGKLEIRGPEAAAFLDRLYASAHLRQSVGRARYALLCDRTGAVQDDGVACRLDKRHFYVSATTGAADLVYRQMLWWNAQWGMAVDIANVTAACAAVNLAGPKSRTLLGTLTGLDLSPEAFPYMAVREGEVAGIPARLLRVGFVGELGFEIHVPASRGAELWDALAARGAVPFGVEAQRLLRLEKGHAIVGQDTDGLTFPHEAGLAWAIGKTKQGHVGKQAIAVQLGRGLTRSLVGFVLEPGQPLPEESHLVIQNGRIAGRVTSVAHSATLGRAIGLAYVAPGQADPGTVFFIRLSDRQLIPATVVETPFYDRGNERQHAAGDRPADLPTAPPPEAAGTAAMTTSADLARLSLADLTGFPRTGCKGPQAAAWLAGQGLALPQAPNRAVALSGGGIIARLGAEEHLLLGALSGGELSVQPPQLGDGVYALPRRDSHAWLCLVGGDAPTLLSRLCGVDLRPQSFPPFAVAQTQVARLSAIVVRGGGEVRPVYHLLCDMASRDYMWRCLMQAAGEFDGRAVDPAALSQLGQEGN